jgi:murein DD-endopeptidase MepM/ murein hydrolase activator NlpD
VVIVKHDNNLYTIYANMDRLSPFIKKGKRIKKGYIIGRVNNKLIFEVTKNSAHIDPLDLIQAR